MKLIAITFTLVAAGCAASPVPVDGTAPTTGIYRLTETRSGDCRTLQPDDTLDASVVADKPGALGLEMSGPYFGDPSTILGRSWIFFDVENGALSQDAVMCSAVAAHRAVTVDASAPDHLRVRRIDSFSNVAAGAGDCPVAGIVPVADCTQTTELDYTLTEPCPRSCIQSDPPADPASSPAPTLRCSC